MKLSEAKRIIKHGLQKTYYISFEHLRENTLRSMFLPDLNEDPGFDTLEEAKFYAESLAKKTKGVFVEFRIFEQVEKKSLIVVEGFGIKNRVPKE